MIGQHSRSGLDLYILKALGVQQPARHLLASNSILRTDLGVLGDIGLDTPVHRSPRSPGSTTHPEDSRAFAAAQGFT